MFSSTLNRPLVSVHIPKTGGTGFKDLLAALTRGHVYLDYHDRPLSPPGQFSRFQNLALDAVRQFRVRRVGGAAIHGHFLATKYDQAFPEASYAVWLREPVERLVSHYYHWQRCPDLKHELCRRLLRDRLSIAEFARLDGMRNVQTRFLAGRNLNEFDFVGLTEEYDLSVTLFLRIFFPDERVATPFANCNPDRSGERYETDPETRQVILERNEADVLLYERGRQRFEELCETTSRISGHKYSQRVV